MQVGRNLKFNCQGCKKPLSFSMFELNKANDQIVCNNCNKIYLFSDENLKRQLDKFEKLCKQIVDSKEILSETSVGIDIGEHHVKIPYKLLLTRFNSFLELDFEGKKVTIEFRIEPLRDT